MNLKFSKRLAELRIESNMSRAALASLLKINPRTISYWELGQRECNLEQLMQLAIIFKTSADYLLGLEN